MLRGQWCQLYVNYLYVKIRTSYMCWCVFLQSFMIMCSLSLFNSISPCAQACVCVQACDGSKAKRMETKWEWERNCDNTHTDTGTHTHTEPAKIDTIYMCLLACSIGSYASFWCLSFLHSYMYMAFLPDFISLVSVCIFLLLLLLLLWLTFFLYPFSFCQYVSIRK